MNGQTTPPAPAPWWSVPSAELLARLGTRAAGLDGDDAARRLASLGRNSIRDESSLSRLRVFLRQLRNPLLLILVFAAVIALLTAEWSDAGIVLTIVAASVGIGYSREYHAQTLLLSLRERVHTRVSVVRDGIAASVAAEEIVPGDIIELAAGSLVPADAVLLEATDCYVGEAVLTGESFPVPKRVGVVAADTPVASRHNCVFMGTNVRSGTARAVVVETGMRTEFGRIAHRLQIDPPDNAFERGLLRFGYLLTVVMLVMVLGVFAVHVLQGRPPLETLLFAVALAVGMSPELLPAIMSVNLARGAGEMARHGVLVRHLDAIENLGCMDVLCTDKTGTITDGVVRMEGAFDSRGDHSPRVLELAAINAALESGLHNPLDDAIGAALSPDLSRVEKLAEVPFDFIRKRVSVVVRRPGGVQLIVKGAFDHVLEACTHHGDGLPMDALAREELVRLHAQWSAAGTRVLAVAVRDLPERPAYGRTDEAGLCLAGFLTFLDRPKEGVREAIEGLAQLGVGVKLISGDNRLVAMHIARQVGMRCDTVLSGPELDGLHDEALWRAAERTDLFVEVDPNQKERIILALKKMGHVVGFLGDGVNDAPAMHAADTGISVQQAADVAREAADFVLLERDLAVIRRGIIAGRSTFANTIKYVLTTTSANLGNMLSMAAISLYLPFLPLLAGQILLNNFLSDIPAVGIADDRVDEELLARPQQWDIRFIGRFMVEFGLLSSLFDFLTFGVLLFGYHAVPEAFRTGWFVESLVTELVIALVVRTRRPFFRSRPGSLLLRSTLVLLPASFMIPYLPGVGAMGFVPLPLSLLACLLGITLLYVVAAECLKRRFYGGTLIHTGKIAGHPGTAPR